MARLPATVLNTAAVSYLAFRAAFVYLYINGETGTSPLPIVIKLMSDGMAKARTGAWLGASAACLTLFVKAGNAFRVGLSSIRQA